jgi:para-nitrobenzyl esterase
MTTPPFQGAVPADLQVKYTIAFAADGTFSATADCNTVTGAYTTADPAAASGNLALVPGPTSLVLCPEGSYSDLYITAISSAASYAIAGEALTITLSAGGTLQYAPAP